jgi:hypothetical protein
MLHQVQQLRFGREISSTTAKNQYKKSLLVLRVLYLHLRQKKKKRRKEEKKKRRKEEKKKGRKGR